MRYVCLVYFDPRKVFNQSAEPMAVLRDSGPYNEELRASGHLVMDQALKLPDQGMTVRVRDGKMSAVDGPFMETKEVLGGFVLIEARDLNEAVQIAAGIPPVRDRAILMLFAIYGLRESEVAKLRLDDIDWEHDQLRVPRAKRREPQV
jgi:hypothetical protein